MRSRVKTWVSLGLALAVLLPLTTAVWSAQQAELAAQDEYVPGELLIKFADGASLAAVQNTAKSIRAQHLKTFRAIGVHHWRLGKGVSVEQALEILSRPPFRDAIEYAEPNYIVHAFNFPNDPLRNELWGLHNLGQTGGTQDADIDALEAWVAQTGSDAVVVGCIDSGIDYLHEDLADNIWTNPKEIPDNGVDDDGNGYIDDWCGWDFCNDDNDPMDDNGHGTHTAGTIGAVGNNGIGVTGVNWAVKLMPLKFLDACGSGSNADAIEAVLYAASFEDGSGNKIVRITNNSWGGGRRSKALQDAIRDCGALFVAAAGNSGNSRKNYPAGYDLDNIISVAATDHNDELASWSSYGSDWVDLGAPGVDVLCTVPADDYDYKDGTSMSAPHVAGVAALLLAEDLSSTNVQVKRAVLDNVDPLESLSGKTLTGGRVNARAALGAEEFDPDVTEPDPVTDLAADGVTTNSITLTWTATGDDGNSGTAYLYDVRYLNETITPDNWDNATQAQGEPLPQSSGSQETFTLTGLSSGTTYHLTLKVADEVGNYSGLSNVETATTETSLWDIDIVDEGGSFVGALAYDNSGNPAIGYEDYDSDNVKFAHWDAEQECWETEIVDPGVVAHGGVDLAYGPNGNPSLSYIDYDRGELKFAHRNGSSWDIQVIEARSVGGWEPSLEYDNAGNPSVSYCGGKGKTKGLKLARFNPESGSWETELIDRVNMTKKHYTSLAYDQDDNPSIAYNDDIDYEPPTLETLKFARWNPESQSWDIEVVETDGEFYGNYVSLAYDAYGNPSIVHGREGVRFLTRDESGWGAAEVIDYGQYRQGTSLAYSSDGTAFISYSNTSGDSRWVKFARRNGPDNWEWEIVDMVRSGTTSLKFDLNGNPSLSYCDYTNDYLKFAHKTGAGEGGAMSVTTFSPRGSQLSLSQNSPNPFSQTTRIGYSLRGSRGAREQGRDSSTYERINLSVYDLSGRLVETLVDEKQQPGVYQVEWKGNEVTSGVYFYRLSTGNTTLTRKMVVLK